MSQGTALLAELDERIQTVAEQTEDRVEAVSEFLARTRAHWQTWDGEWRRLLAALEARREELERIANGATGLVRVAEERLEEAEAALRAWLAVAQRLAESVKEQRQ
jgi:hypothetical protein